MHIYKCTKWGVKWLRSSFMLLRVFQKNICTPLLSLCDWERRGELSFGIQSVWRNRFLHKSLLHAIQGECIWGCGIWNVNDWSLKQNFSSELQFLGESIWYELPWILDFTHWHCFVYSCLWLTWCCYHVELQCTVGWPWGYVVFDFNVRHGEWPKASVTLKLWWQSW